MRAPRVGVNLPGLKVSDDCAVAFPGAIMAADAITTAHPTRPGFPRLRDHRRGASIRTRSTASCASAPILGGAAMGARFSARRTFGLIVGLIVRIPA
jgi:hypothetical protein